MTCAADDIVIDILMRMQKAFGITGEDAMMSAVEKEARTYWGGDSVYVGKTKFDREKRRHRNARILTDYHLGERPRLLARRYGLSVRRVQQILKGHG